MKQLTFWMFAAAGLALLVLLATPAAAQASAIRADIPFAFTVCDQALPAGEYKFEKENHVIRITRADSRRVWLARLTAGGSDRSAEKLENGMLAFHRYGDVYVLSGFWRPGAIAGQSVMPSRVTREYAKSNGVREVSGTR
jgi:hypothetical protein